MCKVNYTPPVFTFVTPNRVLNFINTCNGRRPNSTARETNETFKNVSTIFYWFNAASIITVKELNLLLSMLLVKTNKEDSLLADIIHFREQLFELFYKLTLDKPISMPLCFIDNALSNAAKMRKLSFHNSSIVVTWRNFDSFDNAAVNLIGRIAYDAIELLTSSSIQKLKICQAQNCDWLFLDATKNQQRKWCTMRLCGNKTKATKFYAKQKNNPKESK